MVVLVWGLCARLEWVGAGPEGVMLVGVKKRPANKGERVSAREDGKFTWLMRAGVSDIGNPERRVFGWPSFLLSQLAATTLLFITLALPSLPFLVTSNYSRFQSINASPSLSIFLRIFHPLTQASSAHLVASQLHLNHRLGTFGGSFRLVAYLDLLSALSLSLPVVLSGWWGRWETMNSFGWVEVGSQHRVWHLGRQLSDRE
jgi:hypothetical protein